MLILTGVLTHSLTHSVSPVLVVIFNMQVG